MRKIASALFLFFPFLSIAQDYANLLANFTAQNPQEKIHVHFDKDYYTAGETIWFKAYLFQNNMPGIASTNFYVQLMDSKGNKVDSKKFPINGATVKGSIDLWDSLPQGVYFISAATPSTLNFTNDSLAFQKTIFVYNPVVKKSMASPAPSVSLQFFPESGHLVHGITTAVAFKATDEYGRPVQVSGVIQTGDGFTIPFKTQHNGMGRASFRADAAKTYTATIAGNTTVYQLPVVEKSGIVLKVEDEKGGKQFTISRSQADKANYQKLMLVAQINNQVVYDQLIDFEDYPSLKGHLLTKDLASGILHFTVFNKDGVPLAERLSFVDNKEYLAPVTIDIKKQNLQKRQETVFDIKSADSLQQSLSVSVTDASTYDAENRQSIISRFLLTSDLRGKVYNPAWYFENKSDSVKTAMDLVMMTNGWSRFSWKKIALAEPAQKKWDDPYLITLAGTVKDDKGNAVKGGMLNVYLEAEDSTTQSFELPVAANGFFSVDSVLFYGNGKMHYVYLANGKEKKVAIETKQTAADPLLTWHNTTMQPVSLSAADASKRYGYKKELAGRAKVLETVTVKTTVVKKPSELVNDQYTKGAFKSAGKSNFDNINSPTPNKTINPVDFSLNNIRQLEMQNGRLVNNRTMSLQSGQKWTVAVFLNEVPTDIAVLRNYRMDEIALIKFYEPGFVGSGSSGPGGALAVYTKTGGDDGKKMTKMDYASYKGYSITKEFSAPDYATPSALHEVADYRTTMYWNPQIFMDSETKSFSVKFFNNDFSKKLRIVVQGFTSGGKLIYEEMIVE